MEHRRALRDHAVILLGERLQFVFRDIARDDQRRVGGRVEAPVEFQCVFRAECRDFVLVADDVAAERVLAVKRGVHFRLKLRHRIVLDPHAQFFQHHVALGQHFRVGQLQVDHAVGLHLHHERQAVFRDHLEIGGEVVAGEGVVLPAVARHDARELAGLDFLRALEHQVFEEMRDAGLARRLVGRADLVPDHMGDDGGAVIGDHQHVHAVGKRETGRGRVRGAIAREQQAEADGEDQDDKRQGDKGAGTEQIFPPGERAGGKAGAGGPQNDAGGVTRRPSCSACPGSENAGEPAFFLGLHGRGFALGHGLALGFVLLDALGLFRRIDEALVGRHARLLPEDDVVHK